jgi:hypothetical protein
VKSHAQIVPSFHEDDEIFGAQPLPGGARSALRESFLVYLESYCQGLMAVVKINTCGYQFGGYIPLFLPERGLCV